MRGWRFETVHCTRCRQYSLVAHYQSGCRRQQRDETGCLKQLCYTCQLAALQPRGQALLRRTWRQYWLFAGGRESDMPEIIKEVTHEKS